MTESQEPLQLLLNSSEEKHFLQVLQETVERKGDSTFASWYNESGKLQVEYTFCELWEEAGYIAHDLLVTHHLSKGDRVVLCYNLGLQFFAAFLGCLRAGIVAVLIYPPSPVNMSKSLEKMNKVVNDSKAKLVLIDDVINLLRINPFSTSRNHWPSNVIWKVHSMIPRMIKTFVGFGRGAENLDSFLYRVEILPEDLAFLQYTSGSTGDPKGVKVTFRALNANAKAIREAAHAHMVKKGVAPDDIVGFSWLPQYHDMGLVYAVIAPFTAGYRCHLISPLAFIRNPLLWIELMSKLRVNWTVAPDFAFRLVARKFMEAKARNIEPIVHLDLSSLKVLQNAAEPIQLDTKAIFENAFRSYGLTNDWFTAGYGLAESVVFVTYLTEYKVSGFKPDGSSSSLVAVAHTSTFAKEQTIKIINPENFVEVGETEVGELWISGPSVAAGYFGKPELTQEVFQAKLENDDKEYLRTGDLAFIENGYLYICGRIKDLIIVNGVNYYPQDIEHAVENASPGVRPGCVAAFSSDDLGGDGDLEIVFEIRNSHVDLVVEISQRVHEDIIKIVGILPSKIVAIKERTICKTTSGKIQRKATRKALHNSQLQIVHIHSGLTFVKSDDSIVTTSSSDDSMKQNKASEPFDEIIFSYFGTGINLETSWDDLGMSSMISIQLRDSLSSTYHVTLAPNVFEEYPTPAALKTFVHGSKGTPIMVNTTDLPTKKSLPITWSVLGILQLIGGVILLLMFSFCIVPAYYFGKLLVELNVSVLWFPIVIPVWMLSFSICLVATKWTVIGKYEEGIVQVLSFAYFRWWFVDRAVAIWEIWVGKFILDTPLLNAFYIAMGAKIDMSTPLRACLREFDLIAIHGFTSISHSINCRKFGTWDEKGPSIRFRPILIGGGCNIKGMVSPGSSIGDGSYLENFSVLPEGAQVPDESKIVGNPAFISGKSKHLATDLNQLRFSIMKILWLVFELYLFFLTMELGRYLWVPYLPKWRYSAVLMWCSLLLWFALTSIITSALLKWILVGKRRSEATTTLRSHHSVHVHKTTLREEICHWAADWHYSNALQFFFITACGGGRIWNMILKLHGMDIDLESHLVTPDPIKPSKLDLVSIKKSFVSLTLFEVESNNRLNKIKVKESTIGYGCKVAADDGDVNISKAALFPFTRVLNDFNGGNNWTRNVETFGILGLYAKAIFYYVFIVLGGIFCSLLPSYELWNKCWTSGNIWIAIPLVVATLVLHVITLATILRLLQPFALRAEKDSSQATNIPMYLSCMRLSYFLKALSVPLVIFRGSPPYNLLLRLLGVKIRGPAIVIDQAIYEYSKITIEKYTIIDSSHVNGHYAEFDRLILGKSTLCGIVNQGTFVACGNTFENESLPWKAYIGTQKQTDNISEVASASSMDIESQRNTLDSPEDDGFFANQENRASLSISSHSDCKSESSVVSYSSSNLSYFGCR